MTGTEAVRHWRTRLEWSVRALAQPGDVQACLFPAFTCVADELALVFEESLRGAESIGLTLADVVLEALRKLDGQLERMSAPQNAAFWADEALTSSEEWARVRALALDVAQLAGWPLSPPEPNPQVYVGPQTGTSV